MLCVWPVLEPSWKAEGLSSPRSVREMGRKPPYTSTLLDLPIWLLCPRCAFPHPLHCRWLDVPAAGRSAFRHRCCWAPCLTPHCLYLAALYRECEQVWGVGWVPAGRWERGLPRPPGAAASCMPGATSPCRAPVFLHVVMEVGRGLETFKKDFSQLLSSVYLAQSVISM